MFHDNTALVVVVAVVVVVAAVAVVVIAATSEVQNLWFIKLKNNSRQFVLLELL